MPVLAKHSKHFSLQNALSIAGYILSFAVVAGFSNTLSLLFLTLHITDDIVRGISKAESSNTALLVLAVFLYGTLVLPERRPGHVIMLLIGLLAAAMPVMHMRGAHYGEIAKSPGGFFFVWTLWALGGLGGFTLILSARGLWDLRRRRLQ
jgi:hypothetical protein